MTTNVPVNAQEVIEGQEARPNDDQFDVFLSYSRKDEEFAKKLEEALENYRLPKDVKTSLGSKNRLSVFRDKRDLVPVAGDYWKTIEGYLARSANLVVVCSPNARQSEYVNHEIKTFLQFHEAKGIIPVLLSGRPNNESTAGPDEYAFPEALCSALSMPLALEFSEFPRERGKVNKGRYHDQWYTLLAKVFGAERAEIERLDAKRQARRRAIFAAVALAAIAVLSVALVMVILSRQEVVQQRDHARRLLYASDMNLAQSAFESGNIGLGRGQLESYLAVNQSGQDDLRGFEWYYLWWIYNGQLATFDGTDDIAFSRDGAAFATATADALTIWDAASLRATASFKLSGPQNAEGHPYTSIALSPDGRTLAYGDSERTMLLDIGSGASRGVPGEGQGTPRFSPDGRLLAVSYGCGHVAVYDMPSLKQIVSLGDGQPASYCADFVAFSPDGRALAYGNSYSVSLWDTEARRDLGGPELDVTLPDSVDQVEAVAFSPDGKILAIGDRSKQLVLWNISTRKVLARLKGHEGWISALAFSPDGKTLYSGSMDRTVRLWDFSSYKGGGKLSSEKINVMAMIIGHTDWIRSIHCSPAGRVMATVSADGTVKLWGEAAGREFDAVERVAAVSPGAKIIATYPDDESSFTEEARMTLFDLRGDEPAQLATMKGMNPTLSPDGKIIATSEGGSGEIKLWDVSTRRELITLQVQPFGRLPAFSSDGRLFTALGSDGKSVILWGAAERRELTPVRNDAALKNYLLSPDGKVIVTVDKDGQRVKSWDAASQRQLALFERKGAGRAEAEEQTTLLDLSPDGKLLAFSDSKEVGLWQTDSTHEPILLGRHAVDVSALAFSPDGKLVAAGDEAGGLKIWDTTTRAELSTFKGHKDAVTALAFSPDGRALASASSRGTVKLHGMASMRELITLTHEPSPTSEIHALQGGEDTVWEIFFSADGRSLITRSGNDILRIWRGANEASLRSEAIEVDHEP